MNRFEIATTVRRIVSTTLAVAVIGCGSDTTRPYHPPADVAGLWTAAASDPTILRLAPSQLVASGAITPASAIFTPDATLTDLDAVAFDADGTLWVASAEDSTLVAFGPASLSGSGGREAMIVITSKTGSLSEPTGIAFDSEHRLWVANTGNETIVRFDREQLASSGAPIPALIIHTPGTPTALAFDAAGSLWVSNSTTNRVFSYSPEQLTEAGFLTPQVVISSNGTSFRNPAGIAFDATGNLWVANPSNTTVVGFSPAQLAATGNPVPQTVLKLTADFLTGPSGLAFDSDGSLWVLGSQNELQKFSTGALGASGTPLPSVSIHLNNYVILWSLAFWPKPAGSPIN